MVLILGIGRMGVCGSIMPQWSLQLPCCSRSRILHLLFRRSCLKVIQMCNFVADLYKPKSLLLC